MGDPETRVKRSQARKRNFIAKKMRETMSKKIHIPKKDREAQRKWRLEKDPDSDYTNIDDWLCQHTEEF